MKNQKIIKISEQKFNKKSLTGIHIFRILVL